MVGRAAQGQPWLLGAIEADMAGDKTFQLPDWRTLDTNILSPIWTR